MNNKITKIKNGRIISENGIVTDKNLYFSENGIIAVTEEELPSQTQIDAKGCYVSAGFIDTHLHGGGGADFMDGGVAPIIKAANMHLSHGTTTMLPTTLACSFETLKTFLKDLRQVMEGGLADANIVGAHLEGPYFCLNQCGAQNPDYIKPPKSEEYREIINTFGDIIVKWSFAPELAGSIEFCQELLKHGIVPSIAHSDATFDEVRAVYDKGLRHTTHLYSGMSTIIRKNGERILGVIESAYYFDDMAVEVIADGKHLPPELLSIIIKSKKADNICLVTDAMRAAGTKDTESFLGRKGEETPCIIEDGIAKLPDRTSFAGSVATADRLVRTLVKEVNTDVVTAVKMMTETPAKILKLKTKGKLQEGFDADIILFDDDINIKKVIVGGKTI